jgi:hypothetical protein
VSRSCPAVMGSLVRTSTFVTDRYTPAAATDNEPPLGNSDR